MPKLIADRTANVFAEPGGAGRFAMAPDSAPAAFFKIMRAAKISASAKGTLAVVVQEREDWGVPQPKGCDRYALGNSLFDTTLASRGGRIVIGQDSACQEIMKYRHVAAALDDRIEVIPERPVSFV